MGMEVFATLAGAAIQGQIVGVHHAKRTHVCSLQNGTEGPYENNSISLDDISITLQNTVRHREHPINVYSGICLAIGFEMESIPAKFLLNIHCDLSFNFYREKHIWLEH